MPNQKFKSENYQEFGGINSKFSPYNLGPMEFLDIKNFDFQTPGALTHRWGSTMYLGQTFAAPPIMLAEFIRLNGTSNLIVGTTHGVWIGATSGQLNGVSFPNYAIFATTSVYNGSVSGFSLTARGQYYRFVNFMSGPLNRLTVDIALNGDAALPILGRSVRNTTLSPAGANYDSVFYDNMLFGADGRKMWKFDGFTTTIAQLTPPLNNAPLNSPVFSSTLVQAYEMGFGLSGTIAFYASYTNSRGVEGPIWPFAVIDAGSVAGPSAVSLGGTMVQIPWQFYPPVEYGISSISIYSYYSATGISLSGGAVWDLPYVFLAKYPVGYQGGESVTGTGVTVTNIWLGTTFGGLTDFTTNNYPPPANPDYISMGISYTILTDPIQNGVTAISIGSYSPQFLEIYQNRLFMAGFSSTPSTVWFSDVAEPEGFMADWNFEVRTNDGDTISCLASYATDLYIFKRRSFYVFTGDNPSNFFLRTITDQYGCLNNRCAVTVENVLFFLDQKGVVMWNGAQIDMASAKIQPVFDTMNYSAAVDVACMAHDKLRNQIVCAIPINGSSANNITLVYDYMAKAWTTYDGFAPSIFATIQGRNNTKNLFYGDTSGRVNWFGPSFLADNGTGFSTYFKTRFLHDMGESTQKVFRRLFINTDSPSAATLSFNINFYQDYGISVVLGTSFVLSQFQNRLEYGISAKSIAFELSNLQTSIPLRIYGFTIESRFQRRV